MGADDHDEKDYHEYMLQIPEDDWAEFSGNVPKSMTYSEKITELIRAYNDHQGDTNDH